MRRFDPLVAVGILLIAAGALFLLQNLGIFAAGVALLWVVLFACAGGAFLYTFLVNRDQWWAIIPGFTLFSLSAVAALNQLAPASVESWGGAVFLGGIGLAFWVVYFADREHWWAVIPGGVLFTLALVAGLSSIIGGSQIGGVFFLGLALTFGLLSLLPTPEGRMTWALIPAGVLFVMGLAITAAFASALAYVLPAGIILVGVYLLLRALGLRQAQ